MSNDADKVVVIGAGMGGLAAALRLAHAGLDVTMVDAGDRPGGKMRTQPSAAGPVDAGPTVLTLRAVFEDLFIAAGTTLDAHLRLLPLPVLARHWWPDGSTLDLFADTEASAEAIRAFGGARAEADFRSFSTASAALFKSFDKPVMQRGVPHLPGILSAVAGSPGILPWLIPGISLRRALAMRFRDPRLAQLFGRYATYVGGAPSRSPAVVALIAHAEARGVWAVEGGMQQLAQVLAGLVQQAGATILQGTAARIETTNARVSGVILAEGRRLPCSAVVHAGDPAALAAGLLGSEVQRSVPGPAINPRSHSAWVWAFAAQPKGLPLAYHNVMFAADPAAEFAEITAGDMPQDPTLYVCAQDRAGPAPTGLERFEIILNAPAAAADGSPRSDAEDNLCRHRTFRTLDRFGLTFDLLPDPTALTTPDRFAALFPGSRGALYGLSPHGLTATFRRPVARTVVPGLYLAGGGVHPGAGIPMATLSGRHAAEAIMTDRGLTSTSARTAMRGGTSMASATMAATPSRSSPS